MLVLKTLKKNNGHSVLEGQRAQGCQNEKKDEIPLNFLSTKQFFGLRHYLNLTKTSENFSQMFFFGMGTLCHHGANDFKHPC